MKLYDVPIPLGTTVLIEINTVHENTIKSDILVLLDQEEKLHTGKASANMGTVVALSEGAKEIEVAKYGEPVVLPGDYILFMQNAGTLFYHAPSEKHYRTIEYKEVLLKLGE